MSKISKQPGQLLNEEEAHKRIYARDIAFISQTSIYKFTDWLYKRIIGTLADKECTIFSSRFSFAELEEIKLWNCNHF